MYTCNSNDNAVPFIQKLFNAKNYFMKYFGHEIFTIYSIVHVQYLNVTPPSSPFKLPMHTLLLSHMLTNAYYKYVLMKLMTV